MSYTSSVTCSGMGNQNSQRLKDIQKAENTAKAYYSSLGGSTERISHWDVDANGNVSHYAHVRREDKLSEKLREEANENEKELIEKNREKNGVSYETTISNAVASGISYIQSMEKQLNGTKFFVGTVSYGQTYGNSTDTNFVINPNFLSKLGTDEATRKQFEEDVKFLNEFSQNFRKQQLAQGREIINQGWFCDENGNWGGWCVSRPTKQGSVLQDMSDNAEKIRKEKMEERKMVEKKLKEHFGDRFKGFQVKWQEEVEQEETEKVEPQEENTEVESESIGGKVGVNVGKTARKIEAAKTKTQLRAVIAEISGDMQEVKAGMEKGWCDESEMEKVNQLMAMAQNKMGQVEDREATPEEENMFALASLM